MTTSKTIAGLIGPTLVAIAAGMLLNIGSFPALAERVSRDPALIFESGILLFVAGLARVHNRWTNGWPVLVTVLGWLFVMDGLARMLFPTGLAAIAAGIGQITGAIIAGAIVLLGLGAFLSQRMTAICRHHFCRRLVRIHHTWVVSNLQTGLQMIRTGSRCLESE
jgi:hypothetical protein